MHFIVWTIVCGIAALLIAVVFVANRLSRSVADFLAAGRCAGRYVVCIAEGIAAMGTVSIIGLFEVYYNAGFPAVWWAMMTAPVGAIIGLSGWVVYRYRQTRALTLGQFFEMRYSRNFRIFAGILCFVSGVLNFGIFPAVGARFFLYFCGLPETISLFGLGISTFAIAMIILLSISLFFALAGGQVAIIVTDFLQGILCNIAFVVILIFVLLKVGWSQMSEALLNAPADASLIHPFQTGQVKDFNVWFFIIAAITLVYSHLSWQGNQGYNASARNPHEARMAKVLAGWKIIAQSIFIVMLPLAAYTLMNHELFSQLAAVVHNTLATIGNAQVQKQTVVPLALRQLFPVGLMGLFSAVFLAGFISTHDTYLHSWGSIFIQDVIMPFRKKPFSPEQHIRLLRWSIVGVAVFIFFFSLFFPQTDYIFMFFALTGAIFAGGSGAAIIGGLYWKKGNTPAAWAAMITGLLVALGGIVLRQIDPEFVLNGQWLFFVAMMASIFIYTAISLLVPAGNFNLDKMLHRGNYALQEDQAKIADKPVRKLNALFGITEEFTFGDKLIYGATIGWTGLWTAVFIIGTAYNFVVDVPLSSWLKYWHFYVLIMLGLGVITTVWFTIGGIRDIKIMFSGLRKEIRNDLDDGTVLEHQESEPEPACPVPAIALASEEIEVSGETI